MEISRVITYFAVSALMLALPGFLETAGQTVIAVGPEAAGAVGKPQNFTQLASNMHSHLINIISVMSYIIGLGFGIKGSLAFKEYMETGGGTIHSSYNEQKTENPAPPPAAKINLNKEIKIEKAEPIKDIFKKEKLYDYDFEDKELNELGVQIQTKVKYLRDHKFLQQDMESLLMVENIEKEYLKNIHQNYTDIPFAKRGNKKMDKSPYSLTYSQLNLILASLDEIENKIVNHNVMHQRANEIFLKEKLASM